MIRQHFPGRGVDEIMGFDLHALLLQKAVDAHGVGLDGFGLSVDGQRHGFPCGHPEIQY